MRRMDWGLVTFGLLASHADRATQMSRAVLGCGRGQSSVKASTKTRKAA